MAFLKLLLLFCHAAREILVPQPGIKPVPPALEAQSQPVDPLGSPSAATFRGR